MTERERLERLVAIERELARRRQASLVDRLRWLPGQHAFLSATERIVLFRAGSNVTGKTWAGAAELIYRMRGKHPFKRVRPGPITAWVVGGGGDQLQTLQGKVWELAPKDEVEDGCYFDRRKGKFVGRFPKLVFKNGSIAEFKAGSQDASAFESGTLDFIWIDEPPEDARTFDELMKRIRQRNGDMRLTLTPADISRPLDWLERRTKSVNGRRPEVRDIHYPLLAEHMIFVGTDERITLADGTPCDEAWINELRLTTPDYEIPVSLDGEWNYRVAGNYFDKVWDPEVIVKRRPDLEGRDDLDFFLGGDHADRAGKQVYILGSREKMADGGNSIHIWDEYVDYTGRATPRIDAEHVKEMLANNGMVWSELAWAAADKPHDQGRGSQKSNQDLYVHLNQLYGLPPNKLRPIIQTVKQGQGGSESPWPGVRWLHDRMAERRFTIDPGCKRLIDMFPRYTGDPREDAKDPVDAVRYGIKPIRYEVKRGPVRPYYMR